MGRNANAIFVLNIILIALVTENVDAIIIVQVLSHCSDISISSDNIVS